MLPTSDKNRKNERQVTEGKFVRIELTVAEEVKETRRKERVAAGKRRIYCIRL